MLLYVPFGHSDVSFKEKLNTYNSMWTTIEGYDMKRYSNTNVYVCCG